MNDFYLRKNGKAIIFDEEGVETSREYEDGMKTILESENRVEKIEKNIVANKKQNRKERRLAVKSAYIYKAKENGLVLVDEIKFATPKTKEMLKLLETLKLTNEKVLVVVKEYTENVILASRNLQNVVVVLPSEIGVLDIVSADKMLIENSAFEEIKEALK